MNDDKDIGLTDEEQETSDLLALLYPESGETADDGPEASAELSELRGLRSLFQEMPDEEPPAAVSNMLLAMAAQQAPTKEEESKGFFARLSDLFMPLAMHPGLAAAATLVLVAGVAGSFYVKGKDKMEPMMVKSEGASPNAQRTKAFRPEASAEVATGDQAEAPSFPEPSFAQDDEAEPAVEEAEAQRPAGASVTARPETRRRADKKGAGSRVVGGLYPEDAKQQKRDRGAGGKSLDEDLGYSSNFDALPERKAKEEARASKASPKPAPSKKRAKAKKLAPKSPPSNTLSKSRSTSSDGFAEPPPPPPVPAQEVEASPVEKDAEGPEDDSRSSKGVDEARAAKLHKQAIAAAKRGECSKVKSIGQQIRGLSSAYYDRSFLSDKSLRACLSSKSKTRK